MSITKQIKQIIASENDEKSCCEIIKLLCKKGSIFGLSIAGVGVIINILTFTFWYTADRGHVSLETMMWITLPAALLITLGGSIFVISFFLKNSENKCQ